MNLLDKAYTQIHLRKNILELLNEAVKHGHIEARDQLLILNLLGWDTKISMETVNSNMKELLDKGNPRVQFCMGYLYSAGLLFDSSVPHSLIYFTFSALGNDQFANMALGYRYLAGIGVEEDCEAALTHYQSVARSVFKDVSERVLLGGPSSHGPMVRRIRLIDEIDSITNSDGDLLISDDIFQYYQFMADKKNVSAMIGLGQLFYYGRHGVEMDHEKAYYYFNLAVEFGNPLAMAYLGEMYMLGSDAVPADSEKALTYLRKSSTENNAIGQTGLGLAYLYGRIGLPIKPLLAVELLEKAASQGWVDAQFHLGYLFLVIMVAFSKLNKHTILASDVILFMDVNVTDMFLKVIQGNSGIKANYKLALQYLTMASHQGNVMAFYHLGVMHSEGQGVLRSCNTATELFKHVAERGKWSRLFTSAYSAFVNQRYYEAFITYQLLSELGYEVAQSNVAFILEEGKVSEIPKSEHYKRAFNQWQHSASQGSTASRIKVGDYFYYGYGINQSYLNAVQQYRIASDVHHNSQALFNLGYMHEQGLGLKRDLYLAKRYYDMAAEASIDARIAVSLALIRLMFYFSMEFLGQFNFFQSIQKMLSGSPSNDGVSTIPKLINEMDWDFYAIPIVAGVLLILLIYIRHRR